MNLVYVVKRFPKVSETFVLHEILELEAQGDHVSLCSLERPHPEDPWHEGAEELASRATYLPGRPGRWVRLVASSISTLAAHPVRAVPALAWCLEWAARERDSSHLTRFGEAAYLRARLPGDAGHVHAHFAHGAATVAILVARLAALPVSFTGHARDIFRLVTPPLFREKAARARFVVAVSEHTAEHMRRMAAPVDRHKVVVVRNGVDPDRFPRRAGEPAGRATLLLVGRLVEKKGIDTLIDACSILAGQGLDFRCEIVGDGPLRDTLGERIRAAGLQGRVWLMGSTGQAAVRAAYERATVFALPCRPTRRGDRDGLPVAIVEAMSVGVPVVTTPVAGIPEVVQHERTGLLVPPGDPDALARAIGRLLGDPGLRARLTMAGWAVADSFRLRDTVRRLRGVFRDGPPLQAPTPVGAAADPG